MFLLFFIVYSGLLKLVLKLEFFCFIVKLIGNRWLDVIYN